MQKESPSEDGLDFWLPETSDRQNFFTYHFTLKKPVKTGKSGKPKRTYRNPVHLALKWQGELESKRLTRAQLARTLNISRARVTQVLAVFEIASEVRERIHSLGDPLLKPGFSERALRNLIGKPEEEQLNWLEKTEEDIL